MQAMYNAHSKLLFIENLTEIFSFSPHTHSHKNSELCRTTLAVSSDCLIGFFKDNYCQSPSSVISNVSKSSLELCESINLPKKVYQAD